MYENFNDFYNDTYRNFYNACEHKELISSNPIPYKIDESLKMEAQYLNGEVIFKNSSINTPEEIKLLSTDIYHELTHYYDESVFKHYGYSDENINVLMLTYSEIHAAYNAMFAFFDIKTLSVKKRIDLNKKTFKNHTMTEHIAFQIATETQSMNNVLGFKNAMYLLGEKRALLKIAKDILSINRAYNFKRIPDFMRDEIINIDKLVDLASYENIDVEQINNNKLKIDIELRRISIKNIPIPDIEGMEDIKKIIENL